MLTYFWQSFGTSKGTIVAHISSVFSHNLALISSNKLMNSSFEPHLAIRPEAAAFFSGEICGLSPCTNL